MNNSNISTQCLDILCDAIKLFNCGNENLNFLPSVFYLINVALLIFVIISYQPQLIPLLQTTLRLHWQHSWVLVVKTIGFFWLVVIRLSGNLASWVAPNDSDQNFLKSEEIKLIICTLVALIPLLISFFLYLKFKIHQSLVLELEEFVRNLDVRRTELGYINRMCDRRVTERVVKFKPPVFRSCPNISFKSGI
jgi:hypothetical protein